MADYFIAQGYEVEVPKTKNDFLDVWGTYKGRKCFQEIYLASQVFETNFGFYACWSLEDECAEVTWSYHHECIHSYDNFDAILGGLKPFKKKKRGAE